MASKDHSLANGFASGAVSEADDTIESLRSEMESLRRDRSELRRRIDEFLSEKERSESQSEALAFHASYLEGELVVAQENLTAASAAADDAGGEISVLKSSIKSLEELAAAKDEKISELENNLRVWREENLERQQMLENILKERNIELVEKIAEQKRREVQLEAAAAAAAAASGRSVSWAAAAAASAGAIAVVLTVLRLRRQN